MRLLGSMLLIVTAFGATAAESREMRVLVTQLEGKVSFELSDSRVGEARQDQVLPRGAQLHVPTGAFVGIVCEGDRWVEVDLSHAEQPRRLDVAQACRRGRRLDTGTFESLLPRSSLVRDRVLEQLTRGDEGDPLTPLLLSPRETLVTQKRPEIWWTRVEDVVEYEIELSGSQPWVRRFSAESVDCSKRIFLGGSYDVCLTPWPEDVADLVPDVPVFLSVGARSGFAAPLRVAGASRVELRTEEEVQSPSDEFGRLLKVRHYRNQRMYRRAVESFGQTPASSLDTRELLEAAELALEIDLPARAQSLARQAFERAEKAELQARALELEALAEVLQQQIQRARELLYEALVLYCRANLEEPQEVVRSILRELDGGGEEEK